MTAPSSDLTAILIAGPPPAYTGRRTRSGAAHKADWESYQLIRRVSSEPWLRITPTLWWRGRIIAEERPDRSHPPTMLSVARRTVAYWAISVDVLIGRPTDTGGVDGIVVKVKTESTTAITAADLLRLARAELASRLAIVDSALPEVAP